MFVPHPGNDLLCSEKLFLWEGPPLAVYGDLVVLFDESIVYSGGYSVLGILSSVSLWVVAGGVGRPVDGALVVVGVMLLLMALCAATKDALRASR